MIRLRVGRKQTPESKEERSAQWPLLTQIRIGLLEAPHVDLATMWVASFPGQTSHCRPAHRPTGRQCSRELALFRGCRSILMTLTSLTPHTPHLAGLTYGRALMPARAGPGSMALAIQESRMFRF